MFRNSVRALEPLALTLTCPTALQVDTSDAFLVSRTFSAPGTGATATTQEISPTANATGSTTIRVCSMAYLKDQTRLLERTPTKQLPLLSSADIHACISL